MSFTLDKYNEISNLIDKNYDDDNAFTIVMETLNDFVNKYQEFKDGAFEKLPESYRIDTKITFMMIKKVYANIKMLEELKNEEDINNDEIKEYSEFIFNINYVCSNIDTVNFEDDNFNSKLKSTLDFISKKNEDVKRLNETFDNLNNTLGQLEDTLKKYVNQKSS